MALDIAKSQSPDCQLIVSCEKKSIPDYGEHAYLIKTELFYGLALMLGAKPVELCESVDQELLHDYLGVKSSYISITNQPKPNFSEDQNLWDQLLRLHLGACGICSYIKDRKITSVYLYNGRLASSYIISRYCYYHQIPVYYYEYALFDLRKYAIYPFYPFHFEKYSDAFLKAYLKQSIDEEHRSSMASNYINRKLNSTFVKDYLKSPKHYYNCSIFLESPHEFIGLNAELSGFIWLSPEELIEKVINDNFKSPIAVRAHPNMVNELNWHDRSNEISAFCKTRGIDYYGPDSKVCSHSLMRQSQLVAVQFSSAAIDAFLLQRPVKIYGIPYFKGIIDCINNLDISSEAKPAELAFALEYCNHLFDRKYISLRAYALNVFGHHLEKIFFARSSS